MAFLHQFVPNSCPILPSEISWKEVSDLDITLEEIRIYLDKYQPKPEEERDSSTANPNPIIQTNSTSIPISEFNMNIEHTEEAATDFKLEFQPQQQQENSTESADQAKIQISYQDIQSKFQAPVTEISDPEKRNEETVMEGGDSV
ncbi:hypothetical protein S245_044313 [Arachis hypogaea]|nr:uncharacterized protein DS421_13g414460 [Arachis hypogaea]